MNEENENSTHGYQDGDLFPQANNAPKPLFPAQETPAVKPLFGSTAEPEAAVKNELAQAGPVAFVEPERISEQASADALITKPTEEPTSYQEHPAAPEISEPIVVRTNEIKEENAFPAPLEVPDQTIETPKNMTENAPKKTVFVENVEAEKAPPEEKLNSARPLPEKSASRFGKIRIREAILPDDMGGKASRTVAIDSTTSIGQILRDARNQAEMPLKQVADATRIRASYIESLEADDFKSLPSGIFPYAYVRTLCEAYELSPECREFALKKVRETLGHREEVPKELLQHLEQDVQKNEKEEKRITKIFYIVSFCAALILALLIAGVAMLALSLRKPTPKNETQQTAGQTSPARTPAVETFNTGKLEALTPAQIPGIMLELPVPGK